MKKIFVSQSSMNGGRNRHHRRLEAVLDKFSLRKKDICEHEEYCNVKKTLDKAHCSKHYSKDCQTSKFYLRYGIDWEQMGVGS